MNFYRFRDAPTSPTIVPKHYKTRSRLNCLNPNFTPSPCPVRPMAWDAWLLIPPDLTLIRIRSALLGQLESRQFQREIQSCCRGMDTRSCHLRHPLGHLPAAALKVQHPRTYLRGVPISSLRTRKIILTITITTVRICKTIRILEASRTILRTTTRSVSFNWKCAIKNCWRNKSNFKSNINACSRWARTRSHSLPKTWIRTRVIPAWAAQWETCMWARMPTRLMTTWRCRKRS